MEHLVQSTRWREGGNSRVALGEGSRCRERGAAVEHLVWRLRWRGRERCTLTWCRDCGEGREEAAVEHLVQSTRWREGGNSRVALGAGHPAYLGDKGSGTLLPILARQGGEVTCYTPSTLC